MMAGNTEKRGLGRGLSALMADLEPKPDQGAPDPARTGRTQAEQVIAIDRIAPNPDQPRRAFPQASLEELAESIRQKGVIQPLILRPDPTDPQRYQIVAGERRWRAAQIARLHELPALVRNFDDREVLEIAIIENIQRADLNAIEEAQGYRHLIDRFGHTQEQLAQAMGKSRSHLANMMRLLQLPEEVLDMVRAGQLSAGHARALITADDPLRLARQVVARGLSVRDVEKAARPAGSPTSDKRPRRGSGKDADTRVLESDLSAALGMSVVIDHDTAAGGGKLTIRYKDLGQLDDLMRLLHTT